MSKEVEKDFLEKGAFEVNLEEWKGICQEEWKELYMQRLELGKESWLLGEMINGKSLEYSESYPRNADNYHYICELSHSLSHCIIL